MDLQLDAVPESSLKEYAENGYALAEQLFTAAETESLLEHYMALRAQGSWPGDFEGVDPNDADPLKRFPRMIHMHRWDEPSLRWLTDSRLNRWMTALLGREPFAVQTMLYFKPPGSRGQALHQDQFYLRVKPGTCIAAWMALDRCDEENGCLQVVPNTGDLALLCTQPADLTESFTDIAVPLAPGIEAVPIRMNAGDVLFFNGSVIHGSFRNRSENRFRRALIGHYIAGEAERCGAYYHPVLRMDGTEVSMGESAGAGPCGTWRRESERNTVVIAP
ncbi:MAG: phytanoyl-CoA dioxygenase family protein [Armatimonadetes bacterium]|nr:phytanoyl-CoA dioxygenase family protein [Armatimonadota bacterium]MDE2206319.1 phytanoyl-CoA dioxygenase family protein [Armatimonadota bacterium]